MKKFIATVLALAVFVTGAGVAFAQTTATGSTGTGTGTADTSSAMTAYQVKTLVKKVKRIKYRSNSTKRKISINKRQLSRKITAVKKIRKYVKNKRLKTKAKSKTTTTGTTGTTN